MNPYQHNENWTGQIDPKTNKPKSIFPKIIIMFLSSPGNIVVTQKIPWAIQRWQDQKCKDYLSIRDAADAMIRYWIVYYDQYETSIKKMIRWAEK